MLEILNSTSSRPFTGLKAVRYADALCNCFWFSFRFVKVGVVFVGSVPGCGYVVKT